MSEQRTIEQEVDAPIRAVVHQSQVTKALRNVLLNEMGLTMDMIRSEATRIVERAVEKHVEHMLNQNQIVNLIHKHLNAVMSRKDIYGHQDKLTEIVTAAAKEEAVRVIRERVSIEVKAP